MEAGEGEFERAGRAADGGFGFEEFDVEAGLGEDDGGGETVGACTDHTRFARSTTCDCWKHCSPIPFSEPGP